MTTLFAVLLLSAGPASTPKPKPTATPSALHLFLGNAPLADDDNPFLERNEALFEPGATLDGKPLPKKLYASFEDGVGDMKDCYWHRSEESTGEIVVDLQVTFDSDGGMRHVTANPKGTEVALCMVGLEFRIPPTQTKGDRVVVLPIRLKPNLYRDAASGSLGGR